MNIFLLSDIRDFFSVLFFIFILITGLGCGMYYSTTVDKSWKPKFHKLWFIAVPAFILIISLLISVIIDDLKEFLIRKEISNKIMMLDKDPKASLYINDTITSSLKNKLNSALNYREKFHNHNGAARIGQIKINYKSEKDSLLLYIYQDSMYENFYWLFYPKYNNNTGSIQTSLFEPFNYLKKKR
ncbi:hypothetical protein [Cytophaga hutchinsonii]|uniref:Uncharacterized protein n=1 Tax=Cytophaga hutchinsonii (strain ATCC 33406 / DSM 1761 / CIP 103989 / NBRC 15051 / NCIMB 9469 / D465) TaxID=269798 RepID=A0A6N4SMD5_CYTH3|nr:hypothetical protein [Cytophaga hutchinsonii]ABG57424.1 hypothetical protein CHU_0131 [Cytophaga hutchinsonii ATCC 33406]SFX97920.1 hypothetical protein SAMN04487930_11632 [Cytophaga hutchinsonii ATCC 33406]